MSINKAFGPPQEIRNFNGENYVGKTLTLELKHTDKYGHGQFASATHLNGEKISCRSPFRISGWVPKVLGVSGETIERVVEQVSLIEHNNGGRKSKRRASSYAEFFNAGQREEVTTHQIGGMASQLSRGGGDPDRADIIVSFKDFEIDAHAWDFVAPEEWYSDTHKGNKSFRFVNGFYKDASEAIEAFSKKPQDGFFGIRFFPVIVLPEELAAEALSIAYQAKSCSGLIISDGNAIVGTRCKPYEYEGVIEDCYKAGGKIPIGLGWSW